MFSHDTVLHIALGTIVFHVDFIGRLPADHYIIISTLMYICALYYFCSFMMFTSDKKYSNILKISPKNLRKYTRY